MVISLLSPQAARCQDDGVFNRINGTRIKNSVFIYFDKDLTLYYSIDDEDITHKLDADMIFNIKNNHKNDFQVYFHFYNPLRTTVKSTQKNVEDPSYKAITDFIAKLPTGATKDASETKDKALPGDDKKMTEVKPSVILNQWILEFVTLIKPDAIVASEDLLKKYNAIADRINDIQTTEQFLFGELNIPSTGSTNRTVSGWVKLTASNLYKVDDDYTKFNDELTTAGNWKDVLAERDKDAKDKLKDVQKLLTSDFDALFTADLIPARLKEFKSYSTIFAKTLTTATQASFASQESLITQDSTLIKRLTDFAKDFSGVSVNGKIMHEGF
ncbi:hypothetical protein D3H65_06210 [Paraflavitalea soli]|uniref:Uncharacterized protein n=2 Tax=Paraflavitalea soli TaxID=2315862 RepID=A0A3B7MK21_9BACT|nr:hypothetical protein D3H65_06210 [Paraflavitalea soli]